MLRQTHTFQTSTFPPFLWTWMLLFKEVDHLNPVVQRWTGLHKSSITAVVGWFVQADKRIRFAGLVRLCIFVRMWRSGFTEAEKQECDASWEAETTSAVIWRSQALAVWPPSKPWKRRKWWCLDWTDRVWRAAYQHLEKVQKRGAALMLNRDAKPSRGCGLGQRYSSAYKHISIEPNVRLLGWSVRSHKSVIVKTKCSLKKQYQSHILQIGINTPIKQTNNTNPQRRIPNKYSSCLALNK